MCDLRGYSELSVIVVFRGMPRVPVYFSCTSVNALSTPVSRLFS